MKRGICQGSTLSTQLYLIFIDRLLREVESPKQGAMLTDLTVNIPTQADDICLVAYKSADMTDLIDICVNYSKRWRFNFSPAKSAAMYFSGKTVRYNRNNPSFYLFGNEIQQKTTMKHDGVTLSSDLSCIKRSVEACHTSNNALTDNGVVKIGSSCCCIKSSN